MLEKLREWLGLDEASQARKREIRSAIDRLIDGTDPRLALLPGAHDKLSAGMADTLDYLASLSWQDIEPVDLSLRGYATDKRLGLLFASPLSMLQALKASPVLTSFFQSASQGDEAWALMGMQCSESARFGMSEQNGEVRSDVAQVVVSFSQHRLMMPSPTREQLMRHASQRGLEVLIAVVARRLAMLQQQRLDLSSELDRLRLKLAMTGGTGVTVIDATGAASIQDTAEPEDPQQLQNRQRALTEALQPLAGLSELSGVLAVLADVLAHPADFFRVEPATVCLNRMGVRYDSASDDGVTELRYEQVVMGQINPVLRAILPVHVNRQRLQELEQQFAEELAVAEQRGDGGALVF